MITQKNALCVLVIFASAAPLTGRSIQSQNQNINNMETITLTHQQNKNVIRDLYEKCLNKRNTAMLQDLISEDYNGVNGAKGPAAFEAPIAALIKAFPDIQWTIEELIEEDNKVVAVWRWKGTQKENFQHIAATQKEVTNGGMAIFKFHDSKVIESKVLTDRLGFLQELGQVPKDLANIRNTSPDKDQVVFVDRFVVPKQSYPEFYERATINRNFIKTLPGFVRDEAYEMKDVDDNIIFITVAIWATEEAIKNAKVAVQQEYARQGFDMSELISRLHIVIERGNFKQTGF
jgi:predicted ester cyclase/heme-degrading monooxygenase HmoA